MSVTIQISSGRGPVECEIAVGLYLEYLLKQFPEASFLESCGPSEHFLAGRKILAYKSAVVFLPDGAAFVTGSIRWICPSPIRSGHRRKNWFIEVSSVDPVDKPISIEKIDKIYPDKRLIRVETFRSPGKGGQNVNKVETGVRVIHLPTGLNASSTTARTQLENKKLAIGRLLKIIDTHNQSLLDCAANQKRSFHDRLKRGDASISFAGLDFVLKE